MPGLFDAINNVKSGIMTTRLLQEVVSQNISNASNEDYSRQTATTLSRGSTFDGQNYYGQGVEMGQVSRVRDELLDRQIRDSQSRLGTHEIKLNWLRRIQDVFNEPSEQGISASLSNFWESWSELATDPESYAARSNVMTSTDSFVSLVRDVDARLARYEEEVDTTLSQSLDAINSDLSEVAQLNDEIFKLEAGTNALANDLRDQRDAALNRLSEQLDITYHTATNGMINVFVGNHPAVLEDKAEGLRTKPNPYDATKLAVYWKYGDAFESSGKGGLAALLEVRDTILPAERGELNAFVSSLITEVNSLYSNGVGTDGFTVLESTLGYDSLGVTAANQTLNLVPNGETRNINISFYDSNQRILRQAGVLIDSADTLSDIQVKLNGIPGLTANILTGTNNNGRLNLQLDTISGDNILGETSFAISNNTGGYDTSGALSLLGFHQTDKTSNTSAAQPLIESRDLAELQSVLDVPDVATVLTTALGVSGSFTLNAFETGTETAGNTDGALVQQFTINVASTDTVNSLIAKINVLTASYGMAATFNGGTNKIEITSTARTDSEGVVQLAGGTDYLRLGFANVYRDPAVPGDQPPSHYGEEYTSLGDTSGLFAQMQLNTFFQGSTASDFALNRTILSADQIHAGFKLGAGENGLALALTNLQHSRVGGNGQFTIGELYENQIAGVGIQVKETEFLGTNEELMLNAFEEERSSISGVNLDEELAKMMMYQRAYEANARAFGVFNQMLQELLNLT